MIKLPDELTIASETKTDVQQAFCNGYNLCLAEVQRLNATAQPVSDDRNKVRAEHAEWSQATFGNVGPIGPLKHLSKEALEAAAEPGDLSEWADMQFLLWDAQRRAGITDEQLIHAMIAKLEANKKRSWGEVKDGEPVNHVDDGWIEWAGGSCPVPGWQEVDVKFRDGDEAAQFNAEDLIWWHSESHDDIVAYREVKS